MNIRTKVVLLVVPLIMGPLLVTGYLAALSARNGITGIATSFLRFKLDDLENYAASQWSLLLQNNMVANREFLDAAKGAVASFAHSLVRAESELIFAVDAQGKVVLSTDDISLDGAEAAEILRLQSSGFEGWTSLEAGGVLRVGAGTAFCAVWLVFPGHRKARRLLQDHDPDIHPDRGHLPGVSRGCGAAARLLFHHHDQTASHGGHGDAGDHEHERSLAAGGNPVQG